MKINESFLSDLTGKITSFWKVATMTTPTLKQKNKQFFILYEDVVKEYEKIFEELLSQEDVIKNYGTHLPSPEEMALDMMRANINTIENRIKRNKRKNVGDLK